MESISPGKIPFNHDATSTIFENAKALRKSLTYAERILWERIRNRKIAGKKFRRQHPIGDSIADFYCHSHRLVIEVDGSIHDRKDVQLFDRHRAEVFKELGISVLRFTNNEVIQDLESVVARIVEALNQFPVK